MQNNNLTQRYIHTFLLSNIKNTAMQKIIENLEHSRFLDENHITAYLSTQTDEVITVQKNEFDTPEDIDDSFDVEIGSNIFSLFYIKDKQGYYYITEVSKQV